MLNSQQAPHEANFDVRTYNININSVLSQEGKFYVKSLGLPAEII